VPKLSPRPDSVVVVDDPAFAEFVQQLERQLGSLRRLFDGQEIEEIFGISTSSRERLIRGGRLPGFRLGRQKIRHSGIDLARILWEGRVRPTPLPPSQQPKPSTKRPPPHPSLGVKARQAKRRGRRRVNPTNRVVESDRIRYSPANDREC
jgi:hypothetical protein